MKEDGEDLEAQPESNSSKQPRREGEFEGLENGLTSEIENRQPRRVEEKEVQVIGVYELHEQGAAAGSSPPAYVLLRDNRRRQVLIWIGRFEAYAISVALEGVSFDRPMTHDLFTNALDRLGCRIDRILIDDLWQDTYYAKISVCRNGETVDIDSRPSDAIAVALRTKAPIYMAESVLEQAAVDEEQ